MRLLLSAALLTIATSLEAQPQNAPVSGKVTSAAGAPIAGANVYSNDLGVSVLTSASGTYRLSLPLTDGRVSTTLRVRAVGFMPQARLLQVHIEGGDRGTIVHGGNNVDFVLQPDPNPLTNVTVPEWEAARVPFSVPRQGSVSNVPGQADPFARYLFPPELVMQHQGALDLQESQREALQSAIQQAQTQVLRMQWALASEGEKLTKLLAAESLDEKEVLAQVDRILMTEREIKRAQMTLMVRIRNTLTAEQRAKLRALRSE